MLLGACHVPEHLCGGTVYLGNYTKWLPFFYLFTFLNETWLREVSSTHTVLATKIQY